MYVMMGVLKSDFEGGGGNIGDALIDHMCRTIITQKAGGGADFLTFTYTDLNEYKIEIINKSQALILSCFTFWNNLKEENPLFKYIDKIKVPIIPAEFSTIIFPATRDIIENYILNDDTKECIKLVTKDIDVIPCREYLTQRILNNNGFKNTTMVGDFGWYNLDNISKPMKRPKKIKKLAFSIAHYNDFYKNQIIEMMDYVRNKFPDSEIYFSSHQRIDVYKNYTEYAEKLGFKLLELKNSADQLSFYEDFDLHIGYRVHGYLAFLRQRTPAILIAQDNRGLGFGHTLNNIGVFKGLVKKETRGKSIFSKTKNEYIPNPNITKEIDLFIDEELESNFRRYIGIPELIDTTLNEKMLPYMKQALKNT